MRKWIAIGLVAILAGCAQPEPVPIVTEKPVTIEVPASLREQCFIPNPPPRGAPQSAVANYVLRLNNALEDCAARHAALVGVINQFKANVEANAAARG